MSTTINNKFERTAITSRQSTVPLTANKYISIPVCQFDQYQQDHDKLFTGSFKGRVLNRNRLFRSLGFRSSETETFTTWNEFVYYFTMLDCIRVIQSFVEVANDIHGLGRHLMQRCRRKILKLSFLYFSAQIQQTSNDLDQFWGRIASEIVPRAYYDSPSVTDVQPRLSDIYSVASERDKWDFPVQVSIMDNAMEYRQCKRLCSISSQDPCINYCDTKDSMINALYDQKYQCNGHCVASSLDIWWFGIIILRVCMAVTNECFTSEAADYVGREITKYLNDNLLPVKDHSLWIELMKLSLLKSRSGQDTKEEEEEKTTEKDCSMVGIRCNIHSSTTIFHTHCTSENPRLYHGASLEYEWFQCQHCRRHSPQCAKFQVSVCDNSGDLVGLMSQSMMNLAWRLPATEETDVFWQHRLKKLAPGLPSPPWIPTPLWYARFCLEELLGQSLNRSFSTNPICVNPDSTTFTLSTNIVSTIEQKSSLPHKTLPRIDNDTLPRSEPRLFKPIINNTVNESTSPSPTNTVDIQSISNVMDLHDDKVRQIIELASKVEFFLSVWEEHDRFGRWLSIIYDLGNPNCRSIFRIAYFVEYKRSMSLAKKIDSRFFFQRYTTSQFIDSYRDSDRFCIASLNFIINMINPAVASMLAINDDIKTKMGDEGLQKRRKKDASFYSSNNDTATNKHVIQRTGIKHPNQSRGIHRRLSDKIKMRRVEESVKTKT